uniref:Kelch domain containing 8A n=1 Tax=Hucho hucho TaxID=62062 RepID=A0A4W5NR82_9TELE
MSVPSALEFHWQSLARLPSGLVHHSLGEVGGQMYMLGGCDATGRPSPALEIYSPEWLSLPPMPTPRAGVAVAVLGKQILVVGGVYNTEEGRWRKRSALREALMGVAVTVKDGRALAAGGMGSDMLHPSRLQQYDLRKNVWALLPPMPTPRYDATAHLLGNKIYVAGGRQCKRTLKVFEVFDSETRSWSTLPNMPCKRFFMQWSKLIVHTLPCLPHPHYNVVYTCTHTHTNTHSNIVLSCLPPGLWLKSEDTVAMKTKRADFASSFLRGRMVVAGGLGEGYEAFHPQKRKWERLAPMAMARCSASSIVIRDRLLVVGGVNQVPSSAHEILYVKEECL